MGTKLKCQARFKKKVDPNLFFSSPKIICNYEKKCKKIKINFSIIQRMLAGWEWWTEFKLKSISIDTNFLGPEFPTEIINWWLTGWLTVGQPIHFIFLWHSTEKKYFSSVETNWEITPKNENFFIFQQINEKNENQINKLRTNFVICCELQFI